MVAHRQQARHTDTARRNNSRTSVNSDKRRNWLRTIRLNLCSNFSILQYATQRLEGTYQKNDRETFTISILFHCFGHSSRSYHRLNRSSGIWALVRRWHTLTTAGRQTDRRHQLTDRLHCQWRQDCRGIKLRLECGRAECFACRLSCNELNERFVASDAQTAAPTRTNYTFLYAQCPLYWQIKIEEYVHSSSVERISKLYWASPVIWHHAVLPAIWHRWTRPP